MHSHHLSRVLLASGVVLFFLSLETFAQSYYYNTPINSSVNTNSANLNIPPQSEAAGPAVAGTTPFVSVSDLAAAGFTGASAEPAKENAFLAPVSYFRVTESVSAAHPEWGSAANLLAVSIQAVADQNWLYNNGQMEVVDISGRTQARVSRPGYYIVVTGPDSNKVVALTKALKAK